MYYSPSKNTKSWLYVWNMAMEKKLQIRRNAANRPWCSSCGSRGDQENFLFWRTESNSPWYWKTKNKCLGLDCLPMISSLSVFLPRASVNLHTGNSCESSEVYIHFLKMLTELAMCVYTSIHILAEISSPWFNKAAKPILFLSWLSQLSKVLQCLPLHSLCRSTVSNQIFFFFKIIKCKWVPL